MPNHTVKTHADGAALPRKEQLAWKIAQMAAHNQQADADVIEMIGNRLIDNAAVAIAAINRQSVRNARLLALGYPHPNNKGARLYQSCGHSASHTSPCTGHDRATPRLFIWYCCRYFRSF